MGGWISRWLVDVQVLASVVDNLTRPSVVHSNLHLHVAATPARVGVALLSGIRVEPPCVPRFTSAITLEDVSVQVAFPVVTAIRSLRHHSVTVRSGVVVNGGNRKPSVGVVATRRVARQRYLDIFVQSSGMDRGS